jgi:ATP-dependent helicase YprA (DUF1998 family)/very-short-patch-repair endonuclease
LAQIKPNELALRSTSRGATLYTNFTGESGVDVFKLRDKVIGDYASYVSSFVEISDPRIRTLVDQELEGGHLWPEPLVQLNPSFEPGESLPKLVEDGALHPECLKIFAAKDEAGNIGDPFRLHQHQVQAVRAAGAGDNYVLTTGTGSGKSLAYIVPIVDHVLRNGTGKGIQAIVVYPMNALANSQERELEKFLCRGYPQGHPPVTFERYTGQDDDQKRKRIIANPPDILLTNYVMLELVLTRPWERKLVEAASGLRFLVFDELHTYRGRQGSDVSLLIRRVREACKADNLLHVGTSATLASGGTWAEQQVAVAKVASDIFGSEVKPERIIGETLRRTTQAHAPEDAVFLSALKERLLGDQPQPQTAEELLVDPLSSWIESNIGLAQEEGTDRLVRCPPQSLSGPDGAAAALADATDLESSQCGETLRQALLLGNKLKAASGKPVFAFRLHQFLSKGESVYASVEPETTRHITLQAQQFVPDSNREKILLPLAFCRECGQEYYSVRRGQDSEGRVVYLQRNPSDRVENDDGEPGYLYFNTEDQWPSTGEQVIARLPDSWVEHGGDSPKVGKNFRNKLPQEVFLSPLGVEGHGEHRAHYLSAPFRFCLNCRVSYGSRQRSDFGKLATLGSEGRSTATTILSLSTVRELRQDEELEPHARKLLSFTDNRQDASLQAGHFNDFVEISLIRSALLKAVAESGSEGLRHEYLARRVFDSLELPIGLYASNPEVEFFQREETDRALREALAYYLYRDLRRGWRVTSPNLEQCGLLNIDYMSLPEFCAAENKWQEFRTPEGQLEIIHPLLSSATPEQREAVCRALLDYMRRELAIRVKSLDPDEQETLRLLSGQYLIAPWSLDALEELERSKVCYPRSRGQTRGNERSAIYLSPRGGFALFLKRPTTFPDYDGPAVKTVDLQQIIPQLLHALTIPGLVQRVAEPRNEDDVAGYQLNASGMCWKASDGSHGFHDPVRVPSAPEKGLRTNPFFINYYQSDARDLKKLEAREHTAQVPHQIREERETKFRKAQIPILYCSPTMELGVDIAELNVVNMRNVPPTPANYAQRSGRAGRSGQPAFVFTYCSSGRPHDQYFFRNPGKMVAGAVTTPRLDLGNEDLLRAHVHAIWLGTANLSLGSGLGEVLDVAGDEPTLDILEAVQKKLDDTSIRRKAFRRAHTALGPTIQNLVAAGEDDAEAWLQRVLDQVPRSFEQACERWCGLYKSAHRQYKRQSAIAIDASRDQADKKAAKRLRNEAEAQLRLLLETDSSFQHSDFYSYRYFASEGFLPGYNFPRLPLSAFLPGRRKGKKSRDNFLTRPRFLAISEFGPRSIIYHEGSRYVINKVILPVDSDEDSIKRRASQCDTCGYLHPLGDDPGPDLCEYCGEELPTAFTNLFRMENVATRRRDRINSDEEERMRLGYELKTGLRFVKRGGVVSSQKGTLKSDSGLELVELTYGHAAELWRMNLGWRRRANKDQLGYLLDVERGFWARNQAVDDDPDDPLTARVERVVPFVRDHRNCLLLKPKTQLPVEVMASLQAAVKTAIQIRYQLEDRELAAEPLPSNDERHVLLFYEAAEGGAGVLRRLIEDPKALGEVAKLAIDLCHFDPETDADRGGPAGAKERCEAACYECLLSYYNQRDHVILDRSLAFQHLRAWVNGLVDAAPGPLSRDEHLRQLMNLTDSSLERRWLNLLEGQGLSLPSHAQELIERCAVRPDFSYASRRVVIFIDGPHHDAAAQKEEDEENDEKLLDAGFDPIRFHHTADWGAILARRTDVFGTPVSKPKTGPSAFGGSEPSPEPGAVDLDLFDDEWHPLIQALADTDGVSVDAGGDVQRDGRVVGMDIAIVVRGDQQLRIVATDDPNAEEIAEALRQQGHTALLIKPDDAALASVLQALGA